MLRRNNIIIFLALVITWGGLSSYFSSTIDEKEKAYIKQKDLITKYNTLKNKYSKSSIEKDKKKIFDFLNLFNISYSKTKSKRENRDVVSIELNKSNANKIISYILNSNLLFENIEIKKIDQYKLLFKVTFYE